MTRNPELVCFTAARSGNTRALTTTGYSEAQALLLGTCKGYLLVVLNASGDRASVALLLVFGYTNNKWLHFWVQSF